MTPEEKVMLDAAIEIIAEEGLQVKLPKKEETGTKEANLKPWKEIADEIGIQY